MMLHSTAASSRLPLWPANLSKSHGAKATNAFVDEENHLEYLSFAGAEMLVEYDAVCAKGSVIHLQDSLR